MTVKSGSNLLHGDTYEFNRLSNLDANDFFYNTQGLKFPTTRRIILAPLWADPFAKTRHSSS